jgi:PAS domain S-box-containing protein
VGVIERAGLVAAVEQAADGIVVTDTIGIIQCVNPAFTTMTGYTRQEAVGQHTRILKSEHQPEAVYQELWNTIRSGRIWQGDMIYRRKDGTTYHEEMRIAPVRDSNGEVVSYIAVKHDVTEQRAAEQAKGFLAAIVEDSEDAIIAYTPGFIILTWNGGAEAVLGHSAAAAIGKPLSILVAPERLPNLPQFAEQLLRRKVIPHSEGLWLHRSGRRVPVSVTGSPVRNAAGEVVAISVILHNISERLDSERAISLLASIVESSGDLIYSVGLDGAIVSWDQDTEGLFRYSIQEIIGKSTAILLPHGRCNEMIRTRRAVLSGHPFGPFDTVRQRKVSRRIDVSISVSPIRDPAGEVVSASTVFRDIGTRSRAERKHA